MRIWTWALGAVLGTAAVAAVNGLASLSGATDVPLYRSDRALGYIPKPDQSGKFLNSRYWAFNHLSMATNRPFRPSARHDVLLIGDSVVLGGNPYSQEQRLGPQLERLTGWAVWPVGAGSWALQNELTYIGKHPEVVRGVDRIILLSNSADFGRPSSWQSEVTHPRSRSPWAAWTILNKYVIKPEPAPPLEPVDPWPDLPDRLARFITTAGKPVDLFFYSTRSELGPGACGHIPDAIRRAAAGRWRCVALDPRWSANLYADSIHPKPEATALLAAIIAGR